MTDTEQQWRDVASAFRAVLRSRSVAVLHEPVHPGADVCVSGCRGCSDQALLYAAMQKFDRLDADR